MKYLLLVTWIYPQQPPANFQLEFDTQLACFAARDGIYIQLAELHQSALVTARAKAKASGMPVGLMEAGVKFPDASAVCVQR